MKKFRKTEYVTISLPIRLYQQIEEMIKETGFRSSTEYIVYLLRRTLGQIEKEKERLSQLVTQKKSAQQIEKIRHRLKRLGYF